MGAIWLPSKRRPSWSDQMKVKRARGRNSRAFELWDPCVGLWTMAEDGGKLVHDLSGENNDGTMTSMDPGTDRVETEMGRALAGGVGHSVDMGAVLGSSFVGVGSMNAWVRPDASGGDQLFGGSNGGNGRFFAGSYNNNRLRIGYGNLIPVVDFPTYWNNSGWNMLTLVGNGDTASLWANARWLWTTASISWGGGITNFFALNIESGGANYEWLGQQTNLSIYNRILLSSEIQRLYAEPWCMVTPRAKVFPAAAAGFRKAQIIGGGLCA